MNKLKLLFDFDKETMSVKTEIIAGITTFLTMAYILAVNPSIYAALPEMPNGAVFTATALAAIVGTLIMAIWAKLPYAIAPGMGLNAYFVYTVCIGMGYSWQLALTAVLIEGVIFIILTLTDLREKLIDAIPDSMKKAIAVGIGLFIAMIGMQNSGIILADESTLLALGDITHGSALLAIIGLFITSAMSIMNIRGALLLGILITTAIGIPMGVTHIDSIAAMPHSIAPIFCKFEWDKLFSVDMLIVVFTFLYIDMFDTIGTLVGVATKTGAMKNGNIPRGKQAFMADAIATVAGACFGTSTSTTFAESAAGVAQGGRSGLTALTTAVCFIAALFFAPLFIAMPSAATAPALILVGVFMFSPIKSIDIDDYSELIPAFITAFSMPFTGSISNGIMLGTITYVAINLLTGKHRKINATMYILAFLFVLKFIFIR